MKQLVVAVCAMTLMVPLFAPGANAADVGFNVLGVGADVHVNKHGVGAGGHVFGAGAGAGVGQHGVAAGGHVGSVVGTGASVGDRGVHTGAHVASIGAGGGETDSTLSRDIDVARRGGRRIEPRVQADVQRATGHDVSDVKIHTDTQADQAAQRIQASAFAVGRDIFFAEGQYRPDTDRGMHTLLHESAHTMNSSDGLQRHLHRDAEDA